MIVDDILGTGFLGIAGFGVWRGQNLWSRHIELKHERELQRLSVDRMEKSAQLEMALTRNLAEIEQMKEVPALSVGQSSFTEELIFSPGTLPFVCGCASHPSWHLHAFKKEREHALPISLGAISMLKRGEDEFGHLCICKEDKIVHTHGKNNEAVKSLSAAGYTVRADHV